MKRYLIFILIILAITFNQCQMEQSSVVKSPNGEIVAEVNLNENGEVIYSLFYNTVPVIAKSKLGLIREDEDFSSGLILNSISGIDVIKDEYDLLHGKKKHVYYKANRKTYHFENKSGHKLDIIFQISNDGVAFRYFFPGKSDDIKTISGELTTYNFPEGTATWIQPIAEAKSGWNRCNPSYEEYYEMDVDISALRENKDGWIYPALFNSNDIWLCISETAPYRDYCGTRLMHKEGTYEFSVGFPSQLETWNEKEGANPNHTLPWYSPWRVIAIGKDLGVIVESTLGTDVAKPNVLEDISYVKPGRASWSWVGLKDDSIVYPVQKRFIDYSARMGWEYCLIDVEWNIKIGYDSIKMLADYAADKGVGIILWYNSSGPWNDVPYEPKSMLLTQEDREKEFSRIKDMGIKGIKVDFFGGDGQDMMSYYIDIFESAAKYGIMVNTHGCTLPRGWHRTYPNLVSMESVKGEEYCTFTQEETNEEPSHSCMLPFTRNVFDPMDFTPTVFGEIAYRERVTTNSFELAQAILFLSGIQHYAETDIGMQKVPDFVKQYMKDIPVSWDESKFIDGYPGKYVIIARKTGKTWYVAGINGEDQVKEKELEEALNIAVLGSSSAYSDGWTLMELKVNLFPMYQSVRWN